MYGKKEKRYYNYIVFLAWIDHKEFKKMGKL